MRTAFGLILCQIETGLAPRSAAAFLGCVHAGAYDGGAISRVVRPENDHGAPPISVIQGAARPGAGPFRKIPLETTVSTGLLHEDGTLSLPRDTPSSADGSEFFICIGRQPALDFGGTRNKDGLGFAAFGRVKDGMDIVRRIGALPALGRSDDPYTRGQILLPPIAILSCA